MLAFRHVGFALESSGTSRAGDEAGSDALLSGGVKFTCNAYIPFGLPYGGADVRGALTVISPPAGCVEGTIVELKADDSEDDDSKQHQQSDLEQGRHGPNDGFQHHLEAWDQSSVKGQCMDV